MKKLFLLIVLGFAIAACEKEKQECPGAAEKTFNLTGFTRVTAAETFSVNISKGTTYSIKAKGCANDLADLDLSVKPGAFLEIQYKGYKRGRYKVDFEITLPALMSVNLAGAATATISGFSGQQTLLSTVLSGTSHCTVAGLPVKIEADNSGTSILNLSGNTNEFSASFSGAAQVNGYSANTTNADVYTSGNARAYIIASQKLNATATGASRIYYKGNPADVQIEATGTAKVIHQQ